MDITTFSKHLSSGFRKLYGWVILTDKIYNFYSLTGLPHHVIEYIYVDGKLVQHGKITYGTGNHSYYICNKLCTEEEYKTCSKLVAGIYTYSNDKYNVTVNLKKHTTTEYYKSGAKHSVRTLNSYESFYESMNPFITDIMKRKQVKLLWKGKEMISIEYYRDRTLKHIQKHHNVQIGSLPADYKEIMLNLGKYTYKEWSERGILLRKDSNMCRKTYHNNGMIYKIVTSGGFKRWSKDGLLLDNTDKAIVNTWHSNGMEHIVSTEGTSSTYRENGVIKYKYYNENEAEEFYDKKGNLKEKSYYDDNNTYIIEVYKGSVQVSYSNTPHIGEPSIFLDVMYNAKYNNTRTSDIKGVIWYLYPNLQCEKMYYGSDCGFHKDDRPACMQYYDNGNIKLKRYYTYNTIYREDESKPASIMYFENMEISHVIYTKKVGNAVTIRSMEYWHANGKPNIIFDGKTYDQWDDKGVLLEHYDIYDTYIKYTIYPQNCNEDDDAMFSFYDKEEYYHSIKEPGKFLDDSYLTKYKKGKVVLKALYRNNAPVEIDYNKSMIKALLP